MIRHLPLPHLDRVCLALSCALIASLAISSSALADVYLNELKIKGDEAVELYNSDVIDADVSGWEIHGDDGIHVIDPGTIIPGGGYLVVTLPIPVLADVGGGGILIDPIIGDQDPIDAVFYGQGGSAPLPPLAGFGPGLAGGNVTLARAPDASAGAPPAPDPFVDGLVWTLDLTGTFGNPNDAQVPQMGDGILLNEAAPDWPGGQDVVELFNPLPVGVDLQDFYLTNGNEFFVIPGGVINPNDFFLLVLPPQFQLEDTGLLYLFDDRHVRTDQFAFWDGPPLQNEQECYARCPDGSAPYLGFDFLTSGGDNTFFVLPCSPGGSNNQGQECLIVPTIETGWGELKTIFRR